MDITTIIVIVALTVLAFGAIAWMEIHSRKANSENQSATSETAD